MHISGKTFIFHRLDQPRIYAFATLISVGLPVNTIKDELKNAGPPLKADLLAASDAVLHIHFTYNSNATNVRRATLKPFPRDPVSRLTAKSF